MDTVTLSPEQLDALKYPTGKFARGTKAETPERVQACIAVIEAFPQQLREEVQGLGNTQLDTRYRPDGWTVRQVVHHLADSHMNAMIRFKWALTEDKPTIKAYFQDRWAEHADARTTPVTASLDIITGVHARWVVLMKAMSMDDFGRRFIHPEQQREQALNEVLELYTWHGAHHLAQIAALKKREGWV